MPTDPLPPSLAEVVNRAVDVVDPEGTNDGVAELQRRLEDRDEPVTAILDDIDEILAEAKGAFDPQDEDPEVVMAAAVATYLAHRRDELDDEPDEILRLAARAEFDGHPPPHVDDWLSARGLD